MIARHLSRGIDDASTRLVATEFLGNAAKLDAVRRRASCAPTVPACQWDGSRPTRRADATTSPRETARWLIRIYLDYNATDPGRSGSTLLPRLRWSSWQSIEHAIYGRRAAQAIRTARRQVAEAIGAQPQEIVFHRLRHRGQQPGAVGVASGAFRDIRTATISAIEHPAVMVITRDGPQRERAGDGDTGRWPGASARSLSNHCASRLRWSTMHMRTRSRHRAADSRDRSPHARAGIVLHTDAAVRRQSCRWNVDELGVDLLDVGRTSSHAPKGVGAPYAAGADPVSASAGPSRSTASARNRERRVHRRTSVRQPRWPGVRPAAADHMRASPLTAPRGRCAEPAAQRNTRNN